MIFVLGLAAASSFCLLWALLPHLRIGLVDLPNSRSSHIHPTPRGGGLSFVVVSSVSALMALASGHGSAAALPLLAFPRSLASHIDGDYLCIDLTFEQLALLSYQIQDQLKTSSWMGEQVTH